MFEQFTEHARRMVFFARYEASQLGSDLIEPEHLLLASFREDTQLKLKLPNEARQAIRHEVATRLPKLAQPIPTSVDLPLSQASKLALVYADEERKSLAHEAIDSGHLLLGLLRLKNSVPAALLQQHGIDLATWRDLVRKSVAEQQRRPQFQAGRARVIDRLEASDFLEPPSSIPLGPAIRRLTELLRTMVEHIEAYSVEYSEQRLKRKPWSRKEALGNLVDWGATYQRWLARALTEPILVVPEYPEDEWVFAQNYLAFSWPDLVDLWIGINRLLVHVLSQIPQEKTAMQCRVGIEPPITLSKLVDRYLAHCEDIAVQILAHL